MEAFLRELYPHIKVPLYYDDLRGGHTLHALASVNNCVFMTRKVKPSTHVLLNKLYAEMKRGFSKEDLLEIVARHAEGIRAGGQDIEAYFHDGFVHLFFGSREYGHGKYNQDNLGLHERVFERWKDPHAWRPA